MWRGLRSVAGRARAAVARLRELPRFRPFLPLLLRSLTRRRQPTVPSGLSAELTERLRTLPRDATIVQRGTPRVETTAALVAVADGRCVVVERPPEPDDAFAAWHRQAIRMGLLPFIRIRPRSAATGPVFVHEDAP